METKQISLTPAEWNVLECLWENPGCTGREAVNYLKKSVGWTRSTVLTMLHRMTEKNLILCETIDGLMRYTSLIERETAALQETEGFLDRVYKGSISMMMSAMTKKQQLSKEEIEELYEILRQAEEEKDE
ncbi:MAG: BlaI/MecI/CopY family transcriptional regulator [Lachnospiraceae bacterium]|nr:BlaI/MecI/CopY family transcriptional regulator [Lachnospiraceae bacterium]